MVVLRDKRGKLLASRSSKFADGDDDTLAPVVTFQPTFVDFELIRTLKT
jgi:hypothetical protein